MKGRTKRKPQDGTPPGRSIGLHPRFTPEGPHPDDEDAFRTFWIEAKKRSLELAEERRDKGRGGAAKTTPEFTEEGEGDISKGEVELRCSMERSEKESDMRSGIFFLGEAALKGDEKAVTSLVDAAVSAIGWLHFAQKSHPEVVSGVARMRPQWPVLGSDEPGWEKEALDLISELNVGKDLSFIKVRFRQVRGVDVNQPARLWAKAAVRVVEQYRLQLLMFSQLIRDFGSSGELAEFSCESGWCLGHNPNWTKEATRLHSFSTETVKEWKPVVRRMIREDLPNFHTLPEWANQRRTAAANGRGSVGEIQNAILDDIVSALARLAPESAC